jgi:hypothetical protein
MMGTLIVDTFDGDDAQRVDIDYADQEPGVVVQLALGGDDDAVAYLLKKYEAEGQNDDT